MESVHIENDVVLFGVQAVSFPQGINQAWADLHKLWPTLNGRTFYGVSHETEGGVVYKACTKQLFKGEAEDFGLVPFVLPKGEYMGETVRGFPQQIPKIGETFQTLLRRNDYDKNGACIEWYLNENDVLCMVRKAD